MATDLTPVQTRALDCGANHLAGAWLAGYTGHTLKAYRADLRDWYAYLDDLDVDAVQVGRAHVEVYARTLEDAGRKPATVGRKLASLASFYGYLVAERIIDRSPCAHIRRPKVDDDQAVGLDTSELNCLLRAAHTPRDRALALLLALNGLRVSEALGADCDDLGTERGHRILWIVRKGGRRARTVLAPVTAEAIDAYRAGRVEGPLFVTRTGRRLLPREATKIIARLARGLDKRVSPHTLRHAFITQALDCGATLRDVQDAAGHADPRTTRRYDRARHNLDRHPTYLIAREIS